MKKIKVIALVLVVLMLGALIVACNPSTGDGDGDGTKTKYTLTVWGSQEDQEMLKAMCAAYAEANPQNEYKFLFGVQSEADAADKVLNDVTSGPDVYSFASSMQVVHLHVSVAQLKPI